MRRHCFSLVAVLFISIAGFSQSYCIPNRFTKADYFKDSAIECAESLVYGQAKDWEGDKTELDLTLFYPKRSVDLLKKRPLIILIHGGSFNGGNKLFFFNEAKLLAKRGFVTASINYRLGWLIDYQRTDTAYDQDFYRACQDSKAAIRFLVHNAELYGIDTSEIFIGGISAGAIAAIADAYYTQADWNTDYPWIENKLGPNDNSSNTLSETYSIKGVISMWGDIRDTSRITANAARHIPLDIFHGTADKLIAYVKTDTINYPKIFTPAQGPYLIAQRYKHLGGCCELNTVINGGHGEGFSDDTLAEKISAFCKSIFCGNCKSEEFSTTFIKK
ncbi:MAG TPA: alpha/beta hydrolase [Bacteroidia bacterium]|nr:alpha/beta hydrolase [Bacteroidia bacterium]